jgi:hypothetical protein
VHSEKEEDKNECKSACGEIDVEQPPPRHLLGEDTTLRRCQLRDTAGARATHKYGSDS